MAQHGLQASGPVGPISAHVQPSLEMRVRLPVVISSFRLPDPPADLEQLSQGIEKCLRILDLAPLNITLRFFGIIWRAPLRMVDLPARFMYDLQREVMPAPEAQEGILLEVRLC